VKIIILGAGQVGSSVARSLAVEANDVTVVDRNPQLLMQLQERSDIRTVTGQASHPDVLLQAGIEDADMLLAVTNSDEINMVACQIAHALFHTPLRVARVRSRDYLAQAKLFAAGAVPINFIISPEQLVTDLIHRLIDAPGAQEILDFAAGRVQLVAVRALADGALAGQDLHTLGERLPAAATQCRVVALFRQERMIIPDTGTRIEAGDEVLFLAAPRRIPAISALLRGRDRPHRRIIIAGGGNIGMRLAQSIERDYHVKVIEQDLPRCRMLAGALHRAIVLNGDAADEELLRQERIESTDLFCALTDDDEVNILSAMLAKRLGARKVLAVINRASYADLVKGSVVDIALSPVQVTIAALRPHILRGGVVAAHTLRRGSAEAVEIIVHGDRNTSQVVGRPVQAIDLPEGATIGAIVRREELLFPEPGTVIESQDHVVLLLADRRRIADVEHLFQVAITFI